MIIYKTDNKPLSINQKTIKMREIFKMLDSVNKIINQPIMAPFVDDYAAVEDGETMGTYKLAIPGYSKEDVSVRLKKNRLYIYIDDELEKTLSLTSSIDKDKIGVSVEKGILQITFEKDYGGEGEELEIA